VNNFQNLEKTIILQRKDLSDMNHKTLGDIFQEISDEFAEMKPTSLDELENMVINTMRKVGSYLMDSKMEDWNVQLYQEKQETCKRCGGRLKNKQEERQIATWVSDMTIKRYKSYCPECKETEYPLDQVLGLLPRQRYSNKDLEEDKKAQGDYFDKMEVSDFIRGFRANYAPKSRYLLDHHHLCEKLKAS